MKLIELMGMPIVQSYSEAEAQCAWLYAQKLVEGIISEDSDTLVFGGCLIRNFNKQSQATQIDVKAVLKELGFTMDQFIDFSILCGCDYTEKIRNIGPIRAYSLIKEHKTIERALETIKTN